MINGRARYTTRTWPFPQRGVSDGLLGEANYEAEVPKTHRASYQRGFQEGETLQREIALRVRTEP